jgi:hypothetical protein
MTFKLVFATALAAALTAGCATTPNQPPPNEQLQAAASAISGAEETGAARYAPQELQVAREKLETGRKAAHEGRMTLAKRAAEQATVDAELATARTQAAIARAEADEIKGDIR